MWHRATLALSLQELLGSHPQYGPQFQGPAHCQSNPISYLFGKKIEGNNYKVIVQKEFQP